MLESGTDALTVSALLGHADGASQNQPSETTYGDAGPVHIVDALRSHGHWTKRLRRGMGGAGWVGCVDWEGVDHRMILV